MKNKSKTNKGKINFPKEILDTFSINILYKFYNLMKEQCLNIPIRPRVSQYPI